MEVAQLNRNKPVGFYGPIVPLGPNAPSSECLPNIVPNSDFRTCPDPEFPNALHSEFMNTPNVEFLNVPLCSAPMSYLAGSKWGRLLCYEHVAACWCLQRGWCVASILALWRWGRLQNVSPPSVLFESSQIFSQYTGDTDIKNDGPEF